MTRSYKNAGLSPLPSQDEILVVVKQIEAEGGMHFWGVTARRVADRLHVERPRRLGTRASKGNWSGYMPAATRLAPRMKAMAARGILAEVRNPDHPYVCHYVVGDGVPLPKRSRPVPPAHGGGPKPRKRDTGWARP